MGYDHFLFIFPEIVIMTEPNSINFLFKNPSCKIQVITGGNLERAENKDEKLDENGFIGI